MAKQTSKKRLPKAKAATGRPLFFDAKKTSDMLAWLKAGCSRNDACRRVGCSRNTLDNELARNADFGRQVDEAESASKVLAIGCVTTHAQTNPTVALQYLGRKWPNEWAYRKPDVVTRAQFKSMIDQLVANMLNEVPGEYHARILQSVNNMLLGVVQGDAISEQAADATV